MQYKSAQILHHKRCRVKKYSVLDSDLAAFWQGMLIVDESLKAFSSLAGKQARFKEDQSILPVLLALVLVFAGLVRRQDAIAIFGVYQTLGWRCTRFL